MSETVSVSRETADLAHEALLHMERGVKPWAEIPTEQGESARAAQHRLRAACDELAQVLGRRGRPILNSGARDER